jgi:hypothetical protein
MAKTPIKKPQQIPEVDEDKFKDAVRRLLSTPPQHKTTANKAPPKRK